MAQLHYQKKSKFHRIFDGNEREGGRPLAWQRVLCPKKQQLVESMVPACWQLANLYTPQGYKDNPDNVSESYFQALIAVMRCTHCFDDKYGVKFSSYAYGAAERQVWSYWKQRRESIKGNVHHLNFHDLTGDYSDPLDFMFTDEKAQDALREVEFKCDVTELMGFYEKLKIVNPKWALVLAMRIGFDGHHAHTLSECSEIFNCSRQFASQIYYKAINWIQKAYDQEKKAKEARKREEGEVTEEFCRRNRITWKRMVSALPAIQEVASEGVVLEMLDESRH